MKNLSSHKKLYRGVATVIVLLIMFAITTLALVLAVLPVENSIFATGTVQINLNNGKTIFNDSSMVLAPGTSLGQNFFLKNESSCSVYYRLYLENVEGGLEDVLVISISEGDRILYSALASEFEKNDVNIAFGELDAGELKNLTFTIDFISEAGNDFQGMGFVFDLKAEAVQVKNNPDRVFN